MNATYDKFSDVLYVISGEPTEVEGDEADGGVELNYSVETGEPIGVTVIGFTRNGWNDRIGSLARLVAGHIGADEGSAMALIELALSEADERG